MKCYIVISLPEPSEPTVTQKDIEQFTKHHVLIPDTVWLIADKDRTTRTEILDALNMRQVPRTGSVGATGIVVTVDGSNLSGYAESGIWERLTVWSEE